MDEPDVPSIDVEATMRLMDVADEIRRRHEENEEVLELLEATDREKLKDHLMTLYAGLDEEAEPAHLDQAIDAFLAEQHRFREPADDFELTLAEWYIRRAEIGRRYGIPVLALSILVLVGVTATSYSNRMALLRAEESVEETVEALHRQSRELRLRLGSLSDRGGLAARLPATQIALLDSLRSRAAARLELTEPFLEQYAPGGAADDTVTPANFLEVEGRSAEIRAEIGIVSGFVSEADVIIAVERDLIEARLRLDQLVSEVRTAKAPPALSERAEGAYALAIQSIERRQLESAKEHELELAAIAGDVKELAALAPEASQLHQSIRAVAQEASAIEQADALHDEAQRYIAAANSGQLAAAVDKLRELETTLNLEYQIVIVGGVWRYENRNRDIRNYYLRVQALGPGRTPLPLSITNEETNRVETVREWAERVPKAVYDRIGADKDDNGLIDDNQFGEKARGYLTVERKYPDVGQITEW